MGVSLFFGVVGSACVVEILHDAGECVYDVAELLYAFFHDGDPIVYSEHH
jgi:hypothetical protein